MTSFLFVTRQFPKEAFSLTYDNLYFCTEYFLGFDRVFCRGVVEKACLASGIHLFPLVCVVGSYLFAKRKTIPPTGNAPWRTMVLRNGVEEQGCSRDILRSKPEGHEAGLRSETATRVGPIDFWGDRSVKDRPTRTRHAVQSLCGGHRFGGAKTGRCAAGHNRIGCPCAYRLCVVFLVLTSGGNVFLSMCFAALGETQVKRGEVPAKSRSRRVFAVWRDCLAEIGGEG